MMHGHTNLKFASCRSSGVKNLEVVPTLLENLYTPAGGMLFYTASYSNILSRALEANIWTCPFTTKVMCLFWDAYEAHKYRLWLKCSSFMIQQELCIVAASLQGWHLRSIMVPLVSVVKYGDRHYFHHYDIRHKKCSQPTVMAVWFSRIFREI